MNKVNRNELLKRVQELYKEYPLPLCDGCHKFNVSLKEIIIKGWLIQAYENDFLTLDEFDAIDQNLLKIDIFNKLFDLEFFFKKQGVVSHKIYN